MFGTWKIIVVVVWTTLSGPHQYEYYETFENQNACLAYIEQATIDFQEFADDQKLKYALPPRIMCENHDDEAAVFEEMNRRGGLARVYCNAFPAVCKKLGW